MRQRGLGGSPHERLPKGFPDLGELALSGGNLRSERILDRGMRKRENFCVSPELLERCLLLSETLRERQGFSSPKGRRLRERDASLRLLQRSTRTPTHSMYFVEMVIFPSQRLKDFSLTILTNSEMLVE
ncbi:hypothetical protein [Tolypothrix sp. VBCCA 56010]|uniref:hypothetical protein n=1 Tax=Tolypothrix sp. VBCCA 56010 TaxID=3137731 RepID=UPI003D7DCC2F